MFLPKVRGTARSSIRPRGCLPRVPVKPLALSGAPDQRVLDLPEGRTSPCRTAELVETLLLHGRRSTAPVAPESTTIRRFPGHGSRNFLTGHNPHLAPQPPKEGLQSQAP